MTHFLKKLENFLQYINCYVSKKDASLQYILLQVWCY